MQEKLDNGKWVLGGCCISCVEVNGQSVDTMPTRRCNECGKDFGTPKQMRRRPLSRPILWKHISLSVKNRQKESVLNAVFIRNCRIITLFIQKCTVFRKTCMRAKNAMRERQSGRTDVLQMRRGRDSYLATASCRPAVSEWPAE